jgi:peptide deformylase
MAIRKIIEHPAQVLAGIGAPVIEFNGNLQTLVADMFDTMYAAEGVGLAAPQIGLALRLFVMDCEGLKLVAANPQIISTEGEQTGEEGCLSLGKVPAVLTRANRATLRAQNEQGEWFEETAEGLSARCFLHETDHCNGQLFINHLPRLRREMVVKKFQKERKFR